MRSTRFHRLQLLAPLLLALTTAVQAQDVVNTNRATDLRANPDDSAAVLQMLAAQTRVQVVERKGAWTKVKTDKETGWVRMMHLRGGVVVAEAAPQTASGSALSGFSRLLGGSQPTTQRAQSATLGIRGLSPEELKTATPNAQALADMKSLAATKPDAERFARDGHLAKADVPDPADASRGGRR